MHSVESSSSPLPNWSTWKLKPKLLNWRQSKAKTVEKAIKNAKSIAKLNKRKRNGVYYTPEWVTAYIVRETVGARLEDECTSLDLEIGRSFTEKQIGDYRKNIGKKDGERNVVRLHLKALDEYQDVGAFANQNPRPRMWQRRFPEFKRRRILAFPARNCRSRERERLAGAKSVFDQDAMHSRYSYEQFVRRATLVQSPSRSQQLALWLNTATKRQAAIEPRPPYSRRQLLGRAGLRHVLQRTSTTRCLTISTPIEQEKVNPFDWKATFPEVFGDEV